MNRTAGDHKDRPVNLARPVIKKLRWPRLLVWAAPVLALAIAAFYAYDFLELRGPDVAISFADVSGLTPGQTKVMHLGVEIGQVSEIDLSPDQKHAVVDVRLQRRAAAFAKQGAMFWIVRPEVSLQEISGLATVLSGPYIDTEAGTGEIQNQFTGLDKAPVSLEDGLRVVLKAPRVDRMQAESPVYFRGVDVGVIESIQLDPDSTTVDLHILIRQQFAPLVRANSKFWMISGVDVKGGLLTGVQMKVESLRTLISGGVAFATPEKDMGDPARNGDQFPLYEEAKDEWEQWAPEIPIAAEESDHSGTNLPRPPQTIRATVGSN